MREWRPWQHPFHIHTNLDHRILEPLSPPTISPSPITSLKNIYKIIQNKLRNREAASPLTINLPPFSPLAQPLINGWSMVNSPVPAVARVDSMFHVLVNPKIGVGWHPPKWMVKIMEDPMNKWMIWGYHYFWTHPFGILWEMFLRYNWCVILIFICIHFLWLTSPGKCLVTLPIQGCSTQHQPAPEEKAACKPDTKHFIWPMDHHGSWI